LSSLAVVKSRVVYLSGAGYMGCPEKRPLNGYSNSSSRYKDLKTRAKDVLPNINGTPKSHPPSSDGMVPSAAA